MPSSAFLMSQPTSVEPRDRAFALPASGAVVGLFLSGAAGLIDQICWVRRAALVFGSTTHALSTVLMVFFLGLALGGWMFGRIAQRVRRPMVTCALLEVGLALLVLATPLAFGVAENIYGGIHRALPADSAALWAARAGLVALILLPPTFLMGGTLPLFGRQLVRDTKRIGDSVARLYALNTLGAAAGCTLAGFVLLPRLGMVGSLVVAATLNLIAAGLMALARVPPVVPTTNEAAPTGGSRRTAWIVGSVVFVSGFVALGQEVVWTRFLALLIRTSVHTYALTLALVLVGIVLGSLLVARFADRAQIRGWTFGALQVASGLLVWLLMMLPPAWWRAWNSELAVACLLVLPPAILSGASFPLAVRMVVTSPAWAGIGVGTML